MGGANNVAFQTTETLMKQQQKEKTQQQKCQIQYTHTHTHAHILSFSFVRFVVLLYFLLLRFNVEFKNSGSRFSKGCDREGTRRIFAFTLNSLTKRTGRLNTAEQRNANKF